MAMKSFLHWCVKYCLYSFDNLAPSICIVSLQSITFLFSLHESLCKALVPRHAGLLEVRHTIFLTKMEPVLGNFDKQVKVR